MSRKILPFVILVFVLASVFGQDSIVSGQSVLTNFTYLPMVKRAVSPSSFGAEISYGSGKFSGSWPSAAESGIYWIRRNGLVWSDIQPNNNNEWNWQNAGQLESELALSGRSGNKTILVIRSTPAWAQMYPGYFCGPMQADKIADFANFVKTAVKRYSAAPYFINYYELWNEPDAHRFDVGGPESIYGCWGDWSDDNFGGSYYAQMLSQVYPAIKTANPNAQVLLGGLLLDCDPRDASKVTGCVTDEMKKASRFFEGVLSNNGGQYIDIVNFHGYPEKQYASSNPILLDKNLITWRLNGGVTLGKIDYLRQTMAKYGVSKPIVQSEAALRLHEVSTAPADFERSKADYLVWLYARNLAENLLGTTWYTLDGPGWFSSGLLDANQKPLPAYQAMSFAVSKMSGTAYSREVTPAGGVEGFEFNKGAGRLWVVYTSVDITVTAAPTISLPAGYTQVNDSLGNPITPVNGRITIDHPVYIEFAP